MPSSRFATHGTTRGAPAPLATDYAALMASWDRSLKAANLSPGTRTQYLATTRQFGAFLVATGMPTAVEHIRREHVETYLADVLSRCKAKTAATRYINLRQWFKWLVEEGEITSSPMEHIREPKGEIKPPDILSDAEITRLLKVCAGTDFDARRDTAMIRVLLDTSMRAGELVKIRVADVNFDENIILIEAKGRVWRAAPLGRKTVQALDRYLRVRARHKHSDDPMLWLAKFGALGYHGAYQILVARAAEAGIPHLHPHQFRHTAAHLWLLNGGSERSLKHIGGWKSSDVMARYGAAADAARARAEHKELSPSDRF